MRRTGLVLAITTLVFTACSGAPDPPTFPSGTVRFGSSSGPSSLQVRIADDPAARAQGLMGVTSLPSDSGMAFVWDQPTDDSFWMKNTLIPLTVAFVDEQGRIVTMRDMTPCEAEPCPEYTADTTYVLAIEANAGWFTHAGVGIGDHAKLETPDA